MDNWGYFTQFHPEMELKRPPTYNDPLKRPVKRMILFCQLFSRWGLRMREFSHRSFGEPELGGFQPIRRKGWNLVETTVQFLQIHPFSSKSQLLKANFCAFSACDLGSSTSHRGPSKGDKKRQLQVISGPVGGHQQPSERVTNHHPTKDTRNGQAFFFRFCYLLGGSSQLYSEFFLIGPWLVLVPFQ